MDSDVVSFDSKGEIRLLEEEKATSSKVLEEKSQLFLKGVWRFQIN
jgi:hypothetical protein